MMHTLFMRHGQTNYNLLGLCNDDPTVDVHLSPQGIVQAELAAEKLKDYPLQLIVTSELPRTQQTAAIINRYHRVPQHTQPLLNDIRSGFDSKPVSEYFAATATDPLNIAINGGESLLQHQARVLPYLDWLRRQPYAAVLTVAHEETLRVFYACFNGIDATQLRALHFDNCEFFEYTL